MKKLFLTAVVLLTAGCTHLNGLIDAGDEFGCGAAPGVRCAALSENFDRQERRFDENHRVTVETAEDKATSTEKPAAADAKTAPAAKKPAAKTVALDSQYPRLKKTFHEPRRAAEVVMALWVMPWVDADGDFHGASKIWLKVKDARWQIERERSRAVADTPAPEDF